MIGGLSEISPVTNSTDHPLRKETPYLIHLPHSSSFMPDLEGFLPGLLEAESALAIDWATDQIFAVPWLTMIVADFNRHYCDVERFSDDAQEPMAQRGQGVVYTQTHDGRELRRITPELQQRILDDYYWPHHRRLNQAVAIALAAHHTATIIDGHSFSDHPTRRTIDPSIVCPDICLGADDYHTPSSLVRHFKDFFQGAGLSVAVNVPYAGSIVPLEYYQQDPRVQSIMIEVRKDLYMDEESLQVNQDKVAWLNWLIRGLVETLTTPHHPSSTKSSTTSNSLPVQTHQTSE